jgi:hypothetical protein
MDVSALLSKKPHSIRVKCLSCVFALAPKSSSGGMCHTLWQARRCCACTMLRQGCAVGKWTRYFFAQLFCVVPGSAAGRTEG